MSRTEERSSADKRFRPPVIRFFEQGWFAPFLLSIQPVLDLFSINIAELNFSEIIRSLLIAFLFGVLVLGIARLFLRDGRKASLVASLFILLFFLFGDLADWVARTLGLGPARSSVLILAGVVVCMSLWMWLVQRRIKNVASVNLYFNLLAVLFLISSVIQLGRNLVEHGISFRARVAQAAVIESTDPGPDIYYIILDGYGRLDILQALYDFDNSDFLNELAARGFYVADGSSSNYIQTMLSLSSSFNMDYLQSLEAQGREIETRADLVDLLEDNRVRTILAGQGYRLISFGNEYKATISSAEIFYEEAEDGFASPVSAFESILIDHTMARVLSYIPALNKALIEMPYDTHRQHILFAFEKLQEVPAMDGSYLVYAHVIAPHPPFVFDERGGVVLHDKPFTLNDANYYTREHSRRSYLAGYRRQIQYINTRILQTVDIILSESETPPIIILQGDHGPGAYLHWGSLENTIPAERFGILNAYYFPDQDYTRLYPSISPVNSFRVVLNQFFGQEYETLDDRHYYSSWSFPFDFIEVTDLALP